MSIGTGAAITLGAISAGGAIGSSLIGAHAANKASQQQQAAAQQAIAAQSPLYNRALAIAQQQATQGRADLMPYAQQGGQGLTALTSLLGLPSGSTAAPPAPATGAPGVGPAPAPPASATVLLRAPNGQTQAVPTAQAAFYMARGATRV